MRNHAEASRRWTQVVDLLDAGSLDTGELAAAVFEAADYRLRQLANDQGLGYSFWLLTRIALAARGNTFVEDLSRLGITTDPGLSSLQFIAQVTDRAREQISVSPSEGDFAELGSLALRTALTETVGQQGLSLFGSSVEDLQAAFRGYSTQPTFPIWLNIPLSKSLAFFKPLSICETLAVGMAIITP